MIFEYLWLLLLTGLIGAAIGQSRDRAGAGFFWGLLLGPIGWLIVLLGPNPKKEQEAKERRAQEQKVQKMQEAHLTELRELRRSIDGRDATEKIEEDKYWVRLKGRQLGPIDKMELLQMFTAQSVTLDTEVALARDSDELVFRPLCDEIPALKKV